MANGQSAVIDIGRMDASVARVLKALAALLLLNALLSFENWWPTPAIKPDTRLAPDFVLMWCVLLLVVKIGGMPGRRMLGGLSIAYLLLVVGRYADVTVPALFGRPVNLFWDGHQIPILMAVLLRKLPLWQPIGLVLGVALLFWLLHRILHAAITVAARDAAPLALQSKATLGLTAVGIALSLANLAGVRATWPIISKPVIPTYLRQADLLLTAFSPVRLEAALPPSPAFESDLAPLKGADVLLIFLESYGSMVFDNPDAHRRLAASRDALARAIESSGRQAVSAIVRSPTFAGGSELAHLGLLSGIELNDPFRHDLLLTTRRPTLVSLFRRRGYQTFGLYPALSWDWPERAFYGFDTFYDGRDLGYGGPHFGYWWIPDQFALARFDQMHPLRPDSPPRLLFFPTITSHIPFRPTPPYQPDWPRVLEAAPFDEASLARSLADKPDWLNLYPAYLKSIDYTYTWLAGYLEQRRPRDYLMILIGDHQPASSVSGPDASWDVPVHVISSNRELLRRFTARGFRPGLEPAGAALGAMHDLTRVMLDVLDGKAR
jgi:hypothetical protein